MADGDGLTEKEWVDEQIATAERIVSEVQEARRRIESLPQSAGEAADSAALAEIHDNAVAIAPASSPALSLEQVKAGIMLGYGLSVKEIAERLDKPFALVIVWSRDPEVQDVKTTFRRIADDEYYGKVRRGIAVLSSLSLSPKDRLGLLALQSRLRTQADEMELNRERVDAQKRVIALKEQEARLKEPEAPKMEWGTDPLDPPE